MYFRSYKNYILNKGEEFDEQSFYIHFGFKTREFGENESKDAVKAVFDETDDSDLKDLLYSKYIKSKFMVLKESTHLDLYWNNTLKEVIASNTQKRKLDSIIEREVIERSEKDRRLLNNLTDNSILDLSNEGNCSQAEDVEHWAGLKSNYTDVFKELLCLHPKVVEVINEVNPTRDFNNFSCFSPSPDNFFLINQSHDYDLNI